eukprot:TRINITY_DN1297_c0_g1_i2.p1 TRINITY_DN1297_c0_g1~~TRINITY_DN1297_c0_g1_i2.p1  ORF type:complete len:124 (-),score=22.67 TRINITY_DN1297_c0_g1_i2:76-411(-)
MERNIQKPRKKKHTIILAQFTRALNTRTYFEFESVSKAMGGICKMFEEKLQILNPQRNNIVYNIRELFVYIDQLEDLGALVYEEARGAYVPYDKQWVKQRVEKHLRDIGQR